MGISILGFCYLLEHTIANEVVNIQRNIITRKFLYFISPTLMTVLESNVFFLSIDYAINEDGIILFAFVKKVVDSTLHT